MARFARANGCITCSLSTPISLEALQPIIQARALLPATAMAVIAVVAMVLVAATMIVVILALTAATIIMMTVAGIVAR